MVVRAAPALPLRKNSFRGELRAALLLTVPQQRF
jgi:hypothetical protein